MDATNRYRAHCSIGLYLPDMSAPFSVALPTPLRRRGEIVGLACGALCFPSAFFGQSWSAFLPAGPTGVVLPMALASALAGVLGSALRLGHVDEGFAGFAPRVGMRAGVVAALIGGALTVLAATLHSFGIGHPAPSARGIILAALVLPHSRVWQIFILALLGIPPAVFFGMAGAILTAMARSPRSDHPAPANGGRATPKRGKVFAFLVALATAGYLSPFTLPLRPKPKPVVIAPAPVLAVPTPAPPAKWRYQKPPGFDTAEANRVTITDQRLLGDIEGGLPVALSPDERRLASFRRAGGNVLEIRDLDTLDLEAQVEIPQAPDDLAWSPDGEMLLIITDGPARQLHVFKVAEGRILTLPQPSGARVPAGRAQWWAAREVLFRRDGTPAFLDLDTLRMREAKDSSKWNATLSAEQEALRRDTHSFHLSKNERWQMQMQPTLRHYALPANSAGAWSVDQSLQLVLAHPASAYRVAQRRADIRVGDSVLGTRDGSRVVRIRDGSAMIFYFGLRPAPPNTIRLQMPAAPEPALADTLAKRNLCAFVCAPLINPLNGRTIGPDREQIKALVRFSSWKEQDAELWIEEEGMTIQPGDVVADLHTWEAHRPRAAGQPDLTEWFAVIGQIETQPAPQRSEAPALERQVVMALNPTRGADRVERIEPRNYDRPAPPPRQTPVTAPPAAPPFEPGVTQNVHQALAAFIARHHAKSSRADVNGLLADYAPSVDFFTNGIVDREFIRADKLQYHAPGTRVTETITTPPTFNPGPNHTFAASYSIFFHRIRPDGHWSKGYSDVELQIEITPTGPRIVRQRGQVRDQQKGP